MKMTRQCTKMRHFLGGNGNQSIGVVVFAQYFKGTHIVNISPGLLRPQRSCGQGNIFTPVCHSVHRGGVPDQVHPSPGPGTHPPGTRYTPRDQVHPSQTRYTPRDQVHTPPGTRYTPPGPGTPPPRDQVHPPQSRRHTVNERPVRILLECILVYSLIGEDGFVHLKRITLQKDSDTKIRSYHEICIFTRIVLLFSYFIASFLFVLECYSWSQTYYLFWQWRIFISRQICSGL